MLESIQIKNFQSHNDTEIELSEGVNVFIGLSSAGKSAIMRAIRWLRNNRPAGESFRSNWGGTTTARIILNDKDETTISRIRSDKSNEYLLDDIIVSPIRFKAIGTDVPEEIQKALRIDDICVQGQHDRHFLLSESPGEVARHFNEVAHIEVIDVALKNIQSNIRTIDADICDHKINIDALTEELDDYIQLPSIEEEVVKAESIECEVQTVTEGIKKITALMFTFNEAEAGILYRNNFILAASYVDKALGIFERIGLIEADALTLRRLTEQYEATEGAIRDRNNFILASPTVDKALDVYKHISAIHSSILKLKRTIEAHEEVEGEIHIGKRNVEDLQAELNANFPDICPLCEQEIK